MKPYCVIDTETNSGATDGDLTDLWCVGVFFPEWNETNKIFPNIAESFVLHGHPSDYQEQLQEILDTHVAIFHNSVFDIWVLESFGFEVEDYEDTMLMSYTCYPDESHSLKSWGERFNFPKIEFEDFTKYSTEMASYCIQDCYITWKIFKALDGKVPPIYPIDRDFVRIIIEMQVNGVQIDETAFDGVIESIEQEILPIKEEIDRIAPVAVSAVYKRKTEAVEAVHVQSYQDFIDAGVGSVVLDRMEDGIYHYRKIVPFNPNSGEQVSFVLYKLYGWEPTEFTPSGKPKTDKEVLKELPYQLAELLLQYNKLAKLISTYGNSMRKLVKNGRLHTNYNNCVTKTGRLSSSKPNLQNIPSSGDAGAMIRQLFTAKPGYKLVAIDIDQFQLRILAWYLSYLGFSSYLHLYFAVTEEADPHSLTAKLLYGDNFTKDERKIAKTMNFAVIFGISAVSIARKFGIPIKEAEDKLNLLEEYYGIHLLKENLLSNARANGGHVYTMMGRHGYYPDLLSENKTKRAHAERQAFNFIVQGTEADLIKVMMLTTHRMTVYKVRFVLQIHDEYIFEVPDEYAKEFADELTATVVWNDWLPASDHVPVPMPIYGEAKVGDNWYETK